MTTEPWSVTDGVVTIRPPEPGDAAIIVGGRDPVFERWLGPGSPDPEPVACVVVEEHVVGWVDFDLERDWLGAGEVNVGYHLFASSRGQGNGTRAVALLLHHLAIRTPHDAASVLIDPGNAASLALARRTGFGQGRVLDGQVLLRRRVPPLHTVGGGRVLRPLSISDLDRHLDAIDDAQIDWLWDPGQRELWEAMTAQEQQEHQRRYLTSVAGSFGRGPKWTFALDAGDDLYVSYLDADLANDHCPPGEANLSYACHPALRGRGHTSAGVRLVCEFLREHTATRRVHLVIDPMNEPSVGVARAVGARERGPITDRHGRHLVRHTLDL